MSDIFGDMTHTEQQEEITSVSDTALLFLMLGALCRMVREKDSRSEERVD
jgi:hypothetical protein